MSFWGKKKEAPDLELEKEEREIGVRLGPLSGTRKRSYKVKDDVPEKVQKLVESVLFEKEIVIKPEWYESIPLGELERGASLSIEAKEVFSNNFSLFLMDLDNLKKFEKNNYTKGAILKGTNISSYNNQIKINMTSKYFLIVTSRAIDIDRKVWVRVAKLSS